MGSEQKNALLAVVLSGLILFGWQYYFAPPKPAVAPIEPVVNTKVNEAGISEATPPSAGPIEPVALSSYSISGQDITVDLSSAFTIKNFVNPQAGLKFEDIVGSTEPMTVLFNFGDGFKTVSFTQNEENKFFNAERELALVSNIDEKGRVGFTFTSPKPFKYKFIFKSENKKLENGQERAFSFYTDKLNRELVGDEESGDRGIKWAGIDFNYHLFALYFDKDQSLIYSNNTDKTFTMLSNKDENSLSFHLIFVKKEYNYLTSLENQLNQSVDFGWFGFFAVWILKGLQFFYKFFPNYGVSIILLTLIIRIITFPLQYKSFVSMKKLQLVQPELTKIREKFKDDPQRMQKESMELFRKSGANPIGGCLPLLLQMPVFFAFYKVLYSAVELVDAPFMLWIHDLSNKDPYYVLPLLMTASMFLQQKLTPNTISDPVQKKMMMFMPLVFGFIMKDLPSGLSLYIFVSTVFGILQQLMVFNAKTKNTPVVV